jgi:hypothetical protein
VVLSEEFPDAFVDFVDDVTVAARGVRNDVELEGEPRFDEAVVLVGHHAEVVVGILVTDPVFEGLFAGGVGEERVVGGVEDGGMDGGGGPVIGIVDADGEGVDASSTDAEEVDARAVDGVFFGDLIDDGMEVRRAVGLGVPEGVMESLGRDDDEPAGRGDPLPGAHDVSTAGRGLLGSAAAGIW